MPRPKDTAAIVTHGDHEIITPENKLRGAVSKTSGQSGDDPVARAEKALADLSHQFANWMDAECDRLDKARRELGTDFTGAAAIVTGVGNGGASEDGATLCMSAPPRCATATSRAESKSRVTFP
jgi:hypothetical protein